MPKNSLKIIAKFAKNMLFTLTLYFLKFQICSYKQKKKKIVFDFLYYLPNKYMYNNNTYYLPSC